MQPIASIVAFSLLIVACSGGGRSAAVTQPEPAAPEDPNPAPAPATIESIDMAGVWRVAYVTLLDITGGTPEPLAVGTRVEVVQTPEGYRVQHVLLPGPGNVLAPVSQVEVEAVIGFPLDWYQNEGDGSFLDYGYGWDRLRVAGGAGTLPDYLQYGVRVVASSPATLIGYEAEWTQNFLGEPRLEWLASVIFQREGP